MNRKYSLKQNEEIAKLVHYSKSKQQSVGNKFYAIYFQKTDIKTPKIAFSISKKYGKAVQRNYEKRVTREIVRIKLSSFEYLKAIIVIKVAVQELNFQEKAQQLSYLIGKIRKNLGVNE